MLSSTKRFYRRILPLLLTLPIVLIALRTSARGNEIPLITSNGLTQSVYLPLIQQPGDAPITFIPAGSTWKYLDDGSDQGTGWRESTFDDSTWDQGSAQLGYGDGDEATLLGYGPNPLEKYVTTYFRHTFTVSNTAEITQLNFHLLRDDGAVIYLNGQEVVRSNLPSGPLTYQTLAPLTMGLVGEVMWRPYQIEPTGLISGTNVLAVEVHQNTLGSSDISFDLILTGMPASSDELIRFAAIGDYGKNTAGEAAVANMVDDWAPDFVITLGDNNYPAGEQATIEANIDAYYGTFIEPVFETTHFFPSLGNHDWGDEGIQSITCTGSVCAGPYLDHFSLPGNERYYDFVKGQVRFLVIDSDPHEPNGNTMDSVQAAWLQARLASAPEPWKVVYFHHPPYSSGLHGNNLNMQWPFKEWGASLVLSGHDHNYEHLIVDDFHYFINGSGGANLRACEASVPGSQICFSADYGAMLITADYCYMTLTFTTPANLEIDTVFLENAQCQ